MLALMLFCRYHGQRTIVDKKSSSHVDRAVERITGDINMWEADMLVGKSDGRAKMGGRDSKVGQTDASMSISTPCEDAVDVVAVEPEPQTSS